AIAIEARDSTFRIQGYGEGLHSNCTFFLYIYPSQCKALDMTFMNQCNVGGQNTFWADLKEPLSEVMMFSPKMINPQKRDESIPLLDEGLNFIEDSLLQYKKQFRKEVDPTPGSTAAKVD